MSARAGLFMPGGGGNIRTGLSHKHKPDKNIRTGLSYKQGLISHFVGQRAPHTLSGTASDIGALISTRPASAPPRLLVEMALGQKGLLSCPQPHPNI